MYCVLFNESIVKSICKILALIFNMVIYTICSSSSSTDGKGELTVIIIFDVFIIMDFRLLHVRFLQDFDTSPYLCSLSFTMTCLMTSRNVTLRNHFPC